MIRALLSWLRWTFGGEDPLDVPIGLEDMHELAGGKLPELL
jgi:hypothetical protein